MYDIEITSKQADAILEFCIVRFESGLPMPKAIRQFVSNNYGRDDFRANGVNAPDFADWLTNG